MANQAVWKHRQHELNDWTDKYLKGIHHLHVDGVPGHATKARIMAVKYYLGYGKKRDATYTPQFVRRLRHPHSRDYAPASMLYSGAKRRAKQRAYWRAHQVQAYLTPGVTTYDGVPVAKVAVYYLEYARAHGWKGRLVSGYRAPWYSQQLCIRMCGRPSCPGTCAGTASNHVGNSAARFAIDVSDYYTFGNIMARMPLKSGFPRIHNNLPRDRVHYSPSGN